MRAFFRSHWKIAVAIALLALLALAVLSPNTAAYTPTHAAARLRAHTDALAAARHDVAVRYIADVLAADGYALRSPIDAAGGQSARLVEASLAQPAPGETPARVFIVGAGGNPGAAAAVLELAHRLKRLRPAPGTEIRFVFFVNDAGVRDAGSFIAFAGTLAASRLVRDALSAFRAASAVPARALAAPDYVQGVTLAAHASADRPGERSGQRSGEQAVVVADTAFMRYPYYQTAPIRTGGAPGEADAAAEANYQGVARVVAGLARTIEALAGRRQG